MVYGQPNNLCFLQNMAAFHSWFQAEAWSEVTLLLCVTAVAPFLFVPISPKLLVPGFPRARAQLCSSQSHCLKHPCASQAATGPVEPPWAAGHEALWPQPQDTSIHRSRLLLWRWTTWAVSTSQPGRDSWGMQSSAFLPLQANVSEMAL